MALTWKKVCRSEALSDNEPRHFAIDAADVLVVRSAGTLYAVDNICTHAYACLHEGRVRGKRIICPLHGASFDLRTGAVLGKPATEPLRRYEVRDTDGDVEVGVEVGLEAM